MKFKLDTENAGCDEILEGESIEDVTQDVLNRYEVDELPEGWTITTVDYNEIMDDEDVENHIRLRDSESYTFTDDISQWLRDNARVIAEHLWCPNMESGCRAWLYVEDGEIKASYHTQDTAPNINERGSFLILPIWNDIEDSDESPFDAEYDQVDWLADYIFQGSMDCQSER